MLTQTDRIIDKTLDTPYTHLHHVEEHIQSLREQSQALRQANYYKIGNHIKFRKIQINDP